MVVPLTHEARAEGPVLDVTVHGDPCRGVVCGQNAVPRALGTIAVGDDVEIVPA